MKKRLVLSILAVMLLVSTALVACAQPAPTVTTATTTATKTTTATATKTTTSTATVTATATTAPEPEFTMPDTIYFATRGVGTGVHASTIALSEPLQSALGIKLRIIPLDQNEQIQLSQTQKIDFFMTGGAIWNDVLGMGPSSRYGYGPQYDLRLVWAGIPEYSGTALVATETSGVKLPADVEGKRVAYVPSSAYNVNGVKGYLAFAGLTLDDVELVEFGSVSAAYEGGVQGKVDVWAGNHSGPQFYEAEASPFGCYLIPFDLADEEGWSRFLAHNPNYFPGYITTGAGLAGRDKVMGAKYSLPTIFVRETYVHDEVVSAFCEAMYSVVDEVAEGYEPVAAMKVANMLSPGVSVNAPLHPAAVKFFEDKGLWTDELGKANQAKIDQVNAAKQRWDDYMVEVDKRTLAGEEVNIEEEWKAIIEAEIGYLYQKK